MARSSCFITPKDTALLSLHFNDRELNEKIVTYGKRMNLNVSQVGMLIIREHIDQMLNDLERTEYELLNEEAKVDTIMELKKKLKEAGIDA